MTAPELVAGPSRLLVDGRDVCGVTVADSAVARGRGLLGTSGVRGALWLSRCGSVHMLGMRYPIDAVGVGADGRVAFVRTLRPWTGMTLPRRGVRDIVELAAGHAAEARIVVGSRLTVGAPPGDR